MKYAVALTLAGALAVAVATPSQARWYRHHYRGVDAAIGLGVAGLVGAAVAGSYYGPGYYGPGYAYGPGPYAYDPGPVYVQPMPSYRSGGCWHVTDSDRGYGYYGACY
jgi:hypothetical protein